MTQTITVAGMTCQNCVRHVKQALSAIPGVTSAEVNLESGTARLETQSEVPRAALQAALDEAGYTLA